MPVQTDSAKPFGAKEFGQARGDLASGAETGRAEGRQQRLLRSMVGMGGKPFNSTLTIDFPIHDGGCGAAAARAA
jgi:hypothetical protein